MLGLWITIKRGSLFDIWASTSPQGWKIPQSQLQDRINSETELWHLKLGNLEVKREEPEQQQI